MNETTDCHAFGTFRILLSNDWFDHMTMNISQTTIEAIVIIGELLMIETQQVENRRIKVPNRRRIDFTASSKRIGGPITGSSSNTRTEHPAGKTIGVVVATTRPRLMRGHPTEFGGP